MKQKLLLFVMLLGCSLFSFGQTATLPYTFGGAATASQFFNEGLQTSFSNFTTCQDSATLKVTSLDYGFGEWSDGSFDYYVNGNFIGSGSGTMTFDISTYIPITSVSAVKTDGANWNEIYCTVNITSSESSMPAQPLVASNVTYTQGATPSPLAASLTAPGGSLKWYSTAYGDNYATTAPTPNTGTLGDTAYWVAQANSAGCESERVRIVVHVVDPATIVTMPYSFSGVATASDFFDHGLEVSFSNFTSCQNSASLKVTCLDYGFGEWSDGTFDYYVNGNYIGSGSGTMTFDISQYIPVTSVSATKTSGANWNEIYCTVNITSSAGSMPSEPLVTSDVTYQQNSVATPLTAIVTESGNTLKWFTSESGGGYNATAPTPNTASLGDTTYWVSQANASGCESQRAQIIVHITDDAPSNVSKLAPAYCGITIPNFKDNIEAVQIANAEKYRYRVSDGTNTYTVIRTDNIFRMNMLPSYAYNTTYTIDVSVYIDGQWGVFGVACTVTTPNVPTTQLISGDCNSTITSLGTNLHATPVALAGAYRFRITNGAEVQVFETPGNFFRLNQLASYQYGTTYTIDVAVMIDGDYGDYGSTCTVTTPEIPMTGLNAASCGTIVERFSTNLYATPVVLAQGYRFRITDLNDMSVQIIEGTSSYFRLSQLATYHYNRAYSVEVAVKIDGTYGDYGTLCFVFTPAPPLTQLRAQDCGITVTSFGMNLYADDVVLAQGYRFRVTNGASVNVIDRPNRNFRIKMLPSYTYNTTYTIEVAVMVDGAYGPYGPSCEVSTPTSGMRQNMANNDEDTVRNLSAYPNPFETSFAFALETESNEPVTIQAYDITGKMLENRTVAPDDLMSLKIGENYASGIYSVIVSQGSYSKAVKVVKK